MQEMKVKSLGHKDPMEEEITTHSMILAWRIHGQGSLVGYSPQVHKESNMTKAEHTCMKIKKREEVFVEEKNMNCLREWYVCTIWKQLFLQNDTFPSSSRKLVKCTNQQ